MACVHCLVASELVLASNLENFYYSWWNVSHDHKFTGPPCRSGKLQVVEKVLDNWKMHGHKALVFTQTQQMLDILERLVTKKGYRYHRMDGSTSIANRSRLMDDFNNNPHVFVFLLTTKVTKLALSAARTCRYSS